MDGGPEPEDEGDEEVEIEDEGEPHDLDHRREESKGERDQSSQEVEIGDQREESGKRHSESDEEEYGQHVVTSRRRDAILSGSEEASGEIHFAANDDDEVNHARSPRSLPHFPLPPLSLQFCLSGEVIEEISFFCFE